MKERALALCQEGLVEFEAGKWEKAENYFRQALKADHTCLEPYNLLIQFYVKTGRINKAFSYLEKGLRYIRTEREGIELFKRVGRCMEEADRYEEAIRCYMAALSHYPNEASFYNGLGVCYCRIYEYEKAIYWNEKAIAMEPDNSNYISDLGLAYFEKGELEKAKDYFEKALRINPNNQIASSNLKECLTAIEERKNGLENMKGKVDFSSALLHNMQLINAFLENLKKKRKK